MLRSPIVLHSLVSVLDIKRFEKVLKPKSTARQRKSCFRKFPGFGLPSSSETSCVITVIGNPVEEILICIFRRVEGAQWKLLQTPYCSRNL